MRVIVTLITMASIYFCIWAVDKGKSESTIQFSQGMMIGVLVLATVISVFFDWE